LDITIIAHMHNKQGNNPTYCIIVDSFFIYRTNDCPISKLNKLSEIIDGFQGKEVEEVRRIINEEKAYRTSLISKC